jgi:regulator of RNase E activity RraA
MAASRRLIQGTRQVAQIDVPIVCAGVRIEPGDLVFGDADGVVAIPRAIEQQVLAGAFEKAFGEDHTRRDLAAGMKLKDVFDRYGVL